MTQTEFEQMIQNEEKAAQMNQEVKKSKNSECISRILIQCVLYMGCASKNKVTLASSTTDPRLTRRKRLGDSSDITKRTDHLIELADAILDSNDDNSFDVSKIDSRIRRKNEFSALFEQHFIKFMLLGIVVFFVVVMTIDREVGGSLLASIHQHLRDFHLESELEGHKGINH